MPEKGQSRRSDRASITSGLPREADILTGSRHVSKVPMSDIGECLNGEIFYSLKEGRAKILGFLPLAGYAGAPLPVWWHNGEC